MYISNGTIILKLLNTVKWYDIYIMRFHGTRSDLQRESKLALLLLSYFVHCIMIFVYAFDYQLKCNRIEEFEEKKNE